MTANSGGGRARGPREWAAFEQAREAIVGEVIDLVFAGAAR